MASSLYAMANSRIYGNRIKLGIFLIFSFIVFSFITGQNWGPSGRMTMASLPLMLMLISLSLPDENSQRKILNFRLLESEYLIARFSITRGLLAKLCIVFILVITLILNLNLFQDNLSKISFGAFHQKSHGNSSHNYGWYEVTPENYRITGLAVDRIRKILRLDTIGFLVPDVGGLALCCNNIKIMDLALLTNARLAKKGYPELNNYLNENKPEIIETHGYWSMASLIYNTEFFQRNYMPVIFENNLFWLRMDCLEKLKDMPGLLFIDHPDESTMKNVRYYSNQIDRDYIISNNFKISLVQEKHAAENRSVLNP